MGKISVGLDIGSSSIKVVEIEEHFNQFQLVNCAKMAIPVDSVVGGVVIDHQAVAEAIKKLYLELQIKPKSVVVGVSGEAVILKNVRVPAAPKAELEQTLKEEIQKLIPYTLSNALYDWDVLGQIPKTNDFEVLLAVIQDYIVKSHIECLTRIGLTPTVMDAQPLAILRSLGIGYKNYNGEPANAIAVVDIGANTTQMVIYNEGSLRITRIISIAGQRFTQVITEKLFTTPEQAENLKIKNCDANYIFSEGDPSSEIYQVNTTVRPLMEELVAEIQRSIDYFRLQFRGQEVTKVVVTGGGSKLRHFSSFLERQLKIPVALGNPLAKLKIDSKQFERTEITENAGIFAIAIGLALRGLNPK